MNSTKRLLHHDPSSPITNKAEMTLVRAGALTGWKCAAICLLVGFFTTRKELI
jgi:hypothetical protein